MTLVAGGMALAMLSACHRSNNRNTGMEGTSSVTQVNSENIQPYRITQLDGNKTLKGKRNGKPVDMTSVFMHRTNWDGNASKSSKGCLVIDGRSWRDVENQIGKSSKIYIRVIR